MNRLATSLLICLSMFAVAVAAEIIPRQILRGSLSISAQDVCGNASFLRCIGTDSQSCEAAQGPAIQTCLAPLSEIIDLQKYPEKTLFHCAMVKLAASVTDENNAKFCVYKHDY